MKRVLVTVAIATVVLSGCSRGGDDQDDALPAPSPTVSSSSPTPTPTATESVDPDAPPIDYDTPDDSGFVVADAAGADKLEKASPDFKAFIAEEVVRLQDEAGSDCANKPQIRVSKLQAAGWASGGVFTPECGGYAVLWAKSGTQWSQVWGGQELVDCVTLMRYKFPASVAGQQCLGQNGTSYDYTG